MATFKLKPIAFACSLLINCALAVYLFTHNLPNWRRPGLDHVTITETRDFSGMTVRFKTAMRRTAESLPVKLIPAIRTTHKWVDDKTLKIAFLTAVPPGKNVTVLPVSKQDDAAGHRLKAAPVEVFTPPLSVTHLYTISRDDSSGLHFALEFNGMVNSDSLAKKITLTDLKGEDVPFLVTKATSSRRHTILLGDSVLNRKKLFFTLRAGLSALGGEHPMPTLYKQPLTLPDKLTISLLKGGHYDDSVVIDFTLSSQTRIDQLKKAISISPSVPFDISRRWGSRYRLTGAFQPNSFYRISIEKGLHALHGETLLGTETRTVVTPPLPASVHFLTRGPVLPVSGSKQVPIRVCNMTQLSISGWRIYPNNLQAFFKAGNYHPENYGVPVKGFEKKLDLEADRFHRLNIPVAAIIGENTPGVYVFKTHMDDYWWRTQSRTVVLTDIGLISHRSADKIVVWARSFTTNQPLKQYLVRVISARNQEIGRGMTDDSGKVLIQLDRGEKDCETPYMIIASGNGDVSVMKISDSTQGLAAFDTSGNHRSALPYEAFMYTDRGIYRPGESVRVSTLLRDDTLRAASLVPGVIKLMGPTGRVVYAEPVTTDPQGFHSLSMKLPAGARTGTYTVKMDMPGDGRTWGRASFKVGAFMPDRIKVELRLDKREAASGDAVGAVTQAQYYFGAPAVNCDGNTRVLLGDQPYTSTQYPDFTFGDSQRGRISRTIAKRRFKTDAKGDTKSVIQIPSDLRPRSQLRLMVISTVQEPGGRAVSATQSIPVHAYPFYLGMKKSTSADAASVAIQWVCDPCVSQYTAPGKLAYTLFRISWERVLVKGSKNYHYQWRRKSDKVKTGEILPRDASSGTLILGDLLEGHYECLLEDPESQAATRLNFWHSAGGSDVRPTTLNYLPLKTARMSVDPGGDMTVTYSTPAKGTVMVTGGVNKLDLSFSQACDKGENQLSIRVPATALGSFYLGVTFVADNPDVALIPRRLFGLLKVKVNQASRHLIPTLSFPDNAEPGATIPIHISLAQKGQPSDGYVQIIAVDEGILALTDFKTPDPFGFFYGERSCSLSFADLYNQLFPDLSEAGKVSKAGGGGTSRQQFLSPVAIDHLASSMVALPPTRVSASGQAQVMLTLPAVTGGMRIMAIAFNRVSAGSNEGGITLRKRATVLISAPRAVAPGDHFNVTVQAMNHDLDTDTAEFAFFMNGRPVHQGVPQTFPLPEGAEHRLSIPITAPAKTAGAMAFEARLSLGGVSDSTQAKVTSRPVSTPSFEGQFFALEPGAEKRLDFGNQWFPGTFRSTVEISTTPFLEVAPALAWLRAYPYGCLEQTASAAFPLPYYTALLSPYGAPAASEKKAVLEALNRAIHRIASMEVQQGGFATWPGKNICWVSGSVYACHFLAEARDFGADVDDGLWRRSLNFLRQGVTGKTPMAMADRGYALCLLSRSGKPEPGVALGIANDETSSPFVRFLAALSLLGTRQNKAGDALLNQFVKTSAYLGGDLTWDLDSSLRRKALAANLLLDRFPTCPAISRLIKEIRDEKRQSGHWGSTQANSLAAMAIGKFLAQYPPAATSSGRLISHQGERIIDRDHPVTQTLRSPEVLTVKAQGPGHLFVSTSTFGNRAGLDYKKVNQGLQITRVYVDEAMHPVSQVQKGDLVTVKVTVNTPGHHDNVVVVDLLPGGLEIEDASLATKWAPKDRTSHLRVDSLEKLDDRLLVFCSLTGDSKHPSVFSYTARAISVGEYAIPQVGVECMYKPDIRAASGAQGMFTITPAPEP